MAHKAYLICPVRKATPEQRSEMTQYVDRLEALGTHEFHFPPRDVDQDNDDGGVRICNAHVHAMMGCDEVHVWLNRPQTNKDWSFSCTACGKATATEVGGPGPDQMCQCPLLSQGSVFDLGMAFMLSRLPDTQGEKLKFVVANGPLRPTTEKSIVNLLRSLVDETV